MEIARGRAISITLLAGFLFAALSGRAATPGLTPKSFALSAISNRIVTPNGDGLNDSVVFSFENPRFSEVTGKIYDLHGGQVATMDAGPLSGTTLSWDGRANGQAVGSGVYIYVIEAEGRRYRGALLVVR